MATYMIGYDLNREGVGYSDANRRLTEKIKETFTYWWHHLDSTWIVKSDLTAVNIRDTLKSVLDADDELLVVKLSGTGAWSGFSEKGSSWLKNNL
ncbi:hypothetical protein [Limimaricola cinnabarinus]|uniref:hypothetical protein n=1 Tax=Limimaricola cinnabarinus TaxID=1125964 RepID=UPI0005ECAE40|nr:hypothetical protein [Limimaricola cinnabarinus]